MIIAEEIVRVTNKGQKLDCKNYGLRLYIPQNSLPEDCGECELRIVVSRAKDYTVSTENSIPTSAIYSFSHNLGGRKLRQPVTLEIQHCVGSFSSSTALFFVQSDEVKPPYQFRILPGGKFHQGDDYGSIELDHFCSFFVYLRWRIASLIWTIKHCAVLYYTNIRPCSFQFQLYIAPRLDAVLKVYY